MESSHQLAEINENFPLKIMFSDNVFDYGVVDFGHRWSR